MNLLVDIGHPAHVHLFRNAMQAWQCKGHRVVIAVRDKDVAIQLLDRYKFTYSIVSKPRGGTRGLLLELLEHDWGVLKLARQHKSELLLGTSVSIGRVARLTGARAMVFNEDDARAVRAFALLAYPLAHAIVTPTCLKEDYGRRHIKYAGYQKLAYLHPNIFTPNPAVLSKLGVRADEPYFIMRSVALQAAHDKGETGLSLAMRRKLVQALSQRGRVFITSEGALPAEFEPYRIQISPEDMHNALAFARLLVSDSQTMTAEAAILGTPSVRCNTFVGRISYLEELEHRYQLTFGFRPEAEDRMFECVMELLSQPDVEEIWQQRRQRMLAEKIDVTAWMVDMVERYARGESIYADN